MFDNPWIFITGLLAFIAIGLIINEKVFRQHYSVGLMIFSMLASMGIIGANHTGLDNAWFGVDLYHASQQLLGSIDFESFVMDWALLPLLFAGAMHVKLKHLAGQKWAIGLLASLGVVATTAMVGGAWLLLQDHVAFGATLGVIGCLIFGIINAPTDPIAVGAIMNSLGVKDSIKAKISGESLFNDGMAVVLFIVLLAVFTINVGIPSDGHGEAQAMSTTSMLAMGGKLLLVEAGGGIMLGLLLGAIGHVLLKLVNSKIGDLTITLLVVGLAGVVPAIAHDLWHLAPSGPLAVVVAGLWIGNYSRISSMSDTSREHVDTVWNGLDEALIAVLFLVMGFELLLIELQPEYLIAGVVLTGLTLVVRAIVIALIVGGLKASGVQDITQGAYWVLVWGRLCGGISFALALLLPPDLPGRDMILTATYISVAFSIIVQGSTIKWVIEKALKSDTPQASAAA